MNMRKTFLRKMFLLLFVIGSLFVINTSFVNACSCILQTPQEAFEQASAVFIGKVINIDFSDEMFNISGDLKNVTFEVLEIWKGPNNETIVITTGMNEGISSCTYPFENNEIYLVYAYEEENKLVTNICSRTKLLSDAKEDIEYLRRSGLDKEKKIDVENNLEYLGNLKYLGNFEYLGKSEVVTNSLEPDELNKKSVPKTSKFATILLILGMVIILIIVVVFIVRKYKK